MPSAAARKAHVFFTGKTGAAQYISRVFSRTLEYLRYESKPENHGLPLEGFYSETRETVNRKGVVKIIAHEMSTLGGEKFTVSELPPSKPVKSKVVAPQMYVGDYTVNVEKFDEIILPLLQASLEKSADTHCVFLMDGLNRTTACSNAFLELLREAIDRPGKLHLVSTMAFPTATNSGYTPNLQSALRYITTHPRCFVHEVTAQKFGRSADLLMGKLMEDIDGVD